MMRGTMKYGVAHVQGGFRSIIANEGPKWTRYVYIDGHVVKAARIRCHLAYQPLEGYTLKQLAKRFSRKRNCLGIRMTVTKGARKMLMKAKHS